MYNYNIILYTCFEDLSACKMSAMNFCSKHMLRLRFLHRMAVDMAITALRSDWVAIRLLFLLRTLPGCFRTFSGLVHSLRIDNKVGARFSISLMIISHLKLSRVCGLVFFRTESCLSEHITRTSSRTNFPTLAMTAALTSLWFDHSSAIATLLPRATSLPNFFRVGVKTMDLGFAYPREIYTRVQCHKH